MWQPWLQSCTNPFLNVAGWQGNFDENLWPKFVVIPAKT